MNENSKCHEITMILQLSNEMINVASSQMKKNKHKTDENKN
jgi:hypothetical protein